MPVSKTRKVGGGIISQPITHDALDNLSPIDDIVRRLCRLCWIVNEPETTGKLFQLGIQLGGTNIGKIQDNMFLNQVPHNRYVRRYFYDMAATATLDAVQCCSKGKISNRMKITSMFPEMNPSMDSYRYVDFCLFDVRFYAGLFLLKSRLVFYMISVCCESKRRRRKTDTCTFA